VGLKELKADWFPNPFKLQLQQETSKSKGKG